MAEILKVSDLRQTLREAAIGVGFDADDTITRHGALRAWAQWRLGDPQWAEDFVAFYQNPTEPAG